MSSSLSTSSSSSLTNVLSKSKSPYLLQHKDNPVAWQEFTPATIALAKQLGKPIFLSSGYSACHWCHVLAHESFEDEEVAKMMNDWFVNIKIDREERPDVDRLYMSYLQATSGGGGWPMSIFLTPNLEPFFAGTYFPKTRFQSLLKRIRELWADEKEQCIAMGKGAVESLREIGGEGVRISSRLSGTLDQVLSTHPEGKIYSQLIRQYDPRYGGFASGGARSRGPKFPSCSMSLEPLARLATFPLPDSVPGGPDVQRISREMALKMLRGIWEGGIHDWVGGGMARYSVDEKWIVPHFEKMLYDQAQLVTSALDFALILNDPPITGSDVSQSIRNDQGLCFDLAADILEYSVRDLLSPEGAFWSAEDADSAAEPGGKKSEGAFYIWDKREVDEILGPDAEMVNYFFDVKMDGNVNPQHDGHGEMTGMNILYQAKSYDRVAHEFGITVEEAKVKIKAGREKLKERRDKRERPGLDDKILTAWNGLMLSALAKAATILPDSYAIRHRCVNVAEGVVRFIKERMWDTASKTLARSWREGKGPVGQTDDYAFLIRGLLDVYEATGTEDYALWAIELQQRLDELFWDDRAGGYFASAPDEHVLVRMKDAQDAAEPSATAVTVHNLSRLSLLHSAQYEHYEKRAEDTYLSIGKELQQLPRAFAYSVCGLMDLQRGYREIIIIGPPHDEKYKSFLSLARSRYTPNQLVIQLDPSNPPKKLAEKNEVIASLVESIQAGKETEISLRVCEGGVCGFPATEIQEVEKLLGL